MIQRGDIFWADLGPPVRSRPAKRRPVLIIQSAHYNQSRLATVVALVVSLNTSLAAVPGNTFLPASATGLPRDSVANVTALLTLNKRELTERAGSVPDSLLGEVERGLRRVLGL